jgi:hypothetical protein
MANNEQLIADLGEAINLSNASQKNFGENNNLFNRSIAAGLATINATIRDIDELLEGIVKKIDGLKARIAELEANGDPGRNGEIEALQQQLAAAQNGQVAATEVMNRALEALRASTTAMDGSIEEQNEPAMTAQLKAVNDSLRAMHERLQGILNDNQAPQAGGKRRRKNKTAKKSRKTKKKRKQKGGYKYKTKQRKSAADSDSSSSNTSSGRGRGRGIYKKSKKRRSTR